MKSIQRRLLAVFMSFVMAAVSLPAFANENMAMDPAYDRPDFFSMTADLGIVRPLMIVGTVAGLGIFIASLPFSLLGGNAGEAGKALVVTPAKATFLRCLGCTPAQDASYNELKKD